MMQDAEGEMHHKQAGDITVCKGSLQCTAAPHSAPPIMLNCSLHMTKSRLQSVNHYWNEYSFVFQNHPVARGAYLTRRVLGPLRLCSSRASRWLTFIVKAVRFIQWWWNILRRFAQIKGFTKHMGYMSVTILLCLTSIPPSITMRLDMESVCHEITQQQVI